jgi:hypothetical protein
MGSLIAAALILFGCLMLAWTLFDWHHARMSPKWPTVQGDIVRSEISVPAQRTRRERWYWHVHYRYSVGGHQYTGWRTYFGVMAPIPVARRIVQRFPLRSRVTVYHHPSSHGRSVLMPGVNAYTRRGFAIAPLCWAMAWVFWANLS